MIPFSVIPYLMPMIYASTLGTRVSFVLAAPDGFIFALVAIAAIAVLSVITAPFERRFDADVFKKRAAFGMAKAEENDGTFESVYDMSDEERALREEQAERIRRMLGNKDKDDK